MGFTFYRDAYSKEGFPFELELVDYYLDIPPHYSLRISGVNLPTEIKNRDKLELINKALE